MDLVLLGAPGAGKGTQGALLAERLGFPRSPRATCCAKRCGQGTELGQEARRFMDAGELVPDGVILGMVRERLSAGRRLGRRGVRRLPAQRRAGGGLDGMLAELGRRIDHVVYIDVEDDAIVRRMSGRRTDPETGTVYHVEHNPPPAEVAGRVVQRRRPGGDGPPPAGRLPGEHRSPGGPLPRRGVPVHTVDGDRAIDARCRTRSWACWAGDPPEVGGGDRHHRPRRRHPGRALRRSRAGAAGGDHAGAGPLRGGVHPLDHRAPSRPSRGSTASRPRSAPA
jgi:adenylate kinase